jgi:hypothetical protein
MVACQKSKNESNKAPSATAPFDNALGLVLTPQTGETRTDGEISQLQQRIREGKNVKLCVRPASARAPAVSCCRYSLSISASSSVRSWSLLWRCRSFGNSERTRCLSRGGRRRVQQPLCYSAVFGSFSASG